MTDVREISMLEKLLHGDPECQSSHLTSTGESSVCSVEVVARKFVTCQHREFLICQTSYTANLQCLGRGNLSLCGGCLRPTRDCWKVMPV